MADELAAWCGIRAGEVFGLQVTDCEVDRSTAVPPPAPVVRPQLRRHVVHGHGTGAMRIPPGTKASGKTESGVVPPHLVMPLWRQHR